MNRIRSMYRLRIQTLAVPLVVSHPVALFIPQGSLLRVSTPESEHSGMVEVEWNGQRVQIFAVDLKERGELVAANGAD